MAEVTTTTNEQQMADAVSEAVTNPAPEAVKGLALVTNDPELIQMYTENAKVGSENLSGAAPYLKVHSAGRSTTNVLADGTQPNNGYFFYQPTQEQFQTITGHVLTISRGFRAEGMNEKDGKKESVYNQILAGVFFDKGEYKPFLMYMTGMKLSPMWEFGKEASKWTKAKPLPIPMFALSVKLSTKEVKTPYGFSWVIDFEIEKDAEGNPKLVLDAGEFQYLKDSVETVKETIESLIANKATKEIEIVEEDSTPPQRLSTAHVIAPIADADVAEDIPF
jgi:hypothetical protein